MEVVFLSEVERRRSMISRLDPFQVKRKGRIEYCIEELRKKKTVNADEFMAYLSIRFGIRRQTVVDYLGDIEAYGLIEWKGKTIEWVGEEKWKAESEVQ